MEPKLTTLWWLAILAAAGILLAGLAGYKLAYAQALPPAHITQAYEWQQYLPPARIAPSQPFHHRRYRSANSKPAGMVPRPPTQTSQRPAEKTHFHE